MPVMRFDVLIPAADAAQLERAFIDAGSKLAQAGVLEELVVSAEERPTQAEGVREQLAQTYREEHGGRDLEGAGLVRFRLEPRGFSGSVNQLAMALSRLLTPAAQLPDDPVLLENERSFELPARYPWWVEIER